MAKKKYEEAVKNYESAIKKLYENLNSFEDKYEDFLDFSAKMYKMPFADAIVLFNQNPDITKAAELKVWNKLGRKVKRGEKAVFVPAENGKIKFYYDVSQTVGRPLPKLWTVNRDTADQLRDYYANEYGRSFEDFNYVLDKLSYDEVDYYSDDIADNIREKYSLSDEDVEAYIHDMVTAVRRTVAARCSLDNDGKLMVGTRTFALQASLISSPEMFADFLANVNTYAKETINEIYEAVKYVKKGSRSETRLHEMISAAVEGENIEPELPLPDVNNTVVLANGSATVEENVPPFSNDVIAVVVDDVFTDLFWQYHHDNNYQTAEKFLADYLGCDSYIEREEAIAKFVLGSERLTSNSVIDGIEYQYHVTDNGIMIVQNDSDTLTHEMLCNWDTITGLVSDKLRSGEYVPQSIKEENKTFKMERTPEVLESLATKENPQELYEEFFNSIEFHMNPEYNAAPTDMNEEMILGILQYDNFLGRSALDINDYYIQSESMADKTEYIRNAYQKELNTSIQFHVNGIECGYTAYKDGLHIWQGSPSNNISHTAFTWEQLAEYVDELVQNGEYLALNRTTVEEETELFFTPKQKSKRAKSAPVPDDQLSFFSLSPERSEVSSLEAAQSVTNVPTLNPGKDLTIPQEVIDHVLRDGGMERNSVSRIIFLFSRTDDLTEKADFLRQELAEENYGESRGYLIPDDTLAVGVRKYSTWYTSEGLVIAENESIDRAGGAGRKVVSYEEMAERITEQLDNGLYATQQAIDTADYFIIDALADRIRAYGWDNDNEKRPYFLDDSVVGGTAPDAEKRVAELLSDPNSLNELIQGFEAFAEDYANGSAELRWHYRSRYSVEYTLENTKRLALPKKAFKASEELPKKPGYFVSEDQKENLLFRRGQYVRGKFSIDEYFEEHKGKTERAKFLNNFFGIGGGTVTGTSDEWHDSKGFGYAYGDNVSAYGTGGLASTLMKWTEVADIIERLRSSDRYITQQEIDNSILDVKRDIERYNPDKADSYESAVYENNKKWLEKWEPKGTEYKAKAETAEQEQTAEIVTPEQSEQITSEIKKEINRLSREYPALFGGTEQKRKIANTIEHRNFVNMQKMFPDMFSKKHSYEHYGCDEDSGYEPLSVEWILENRISLSHTYVQNGDLMYDPMIDFEIDFEKQTANAIMYEQSSMGIYQEYANGSKGQRDTNSFTKTWLKNIKDQSSARYLERANVEHEYNGESYTIQINYSPDGQLLSVFGDGEVVTDYYAKNNIEPPEISDIPDNEVNVGAVGEYDGETVVVQSINEEEGTAELILTDHEAEIVQEVSAEELEENFNEYVEESVDNHISRAFSSFKNNHDLTDEQLKFLDRAEKQINKAGYDSIDIRRMFEEIPIFGQSYGSYQRVDETMFDGKLDEYVSWLNETFADNTEREPVYVAPQDYVYDPDNEIPTTAKAKYNANVEAIRTLITLEKENRNATPEEQTVLARYSGWGGIPQAFDSNNIVWRNEYNELKELLSESEYSAARATTLSSFYSPPEVVDGVYQALDQFHFLEGNVLEPSMGIGNFFAKIPSDLKDYTQLYGVEIDSISGRIAKKLYPSARIQIKGFEETKYNDNSFDVVIGNVPFGNVKIHDRRYDKLHLPMHDYFAAKAVDQVKPGGIVAFVTSKYTMDKKDTTARKYLAERAELLGAVRLPAGTFKDTDNTTTDILFFKKRNKIDVVNVPEWVYVDENSEGIAYNRYFHDNPDMMLGNMAWDERMRGKYGEDSKVTICLPDESDTRTLSEKISEAVSKIEGTISVAKYEEENKLADMIPADPDVKNFTYTLIDGELYYRENELMRKAEEVGKQRDRIIGMHKIRQAEIALVNAESNGCSDNEMTKLQRELNEVYDKFVKAYGYVTDDVNLRAFRDDDDVTTVAALEIKDENGVKNKAPIFFKRTINPPVVITRVDTAEEALQVSLDRLGRVDIEYMSTIYGNTPDVLIEQLGDMIYRDPAQVKEDEPLSGYVDKSEYLSGNVIKKLDIAKAFANGDSTYNKNVTALESVVPERITAEEISVRLGSPWIEVQDYNRFYQNYTGLSTENTWDNQVARLPNGEYKWLDSKTSYSNAATEIYGTSRMNSFEIFERLLNQREIIVKDAVEDEDGKIRYVPNDKETRFAKEKARQMEQAFKDWIWSDIDRREHYEDIYNRNFNCIVGREYDGSHQHFDGMNPNLALYSHQKDAVMRAKLSGNTLLAHEVGAGKTFEMITIVQEKKRLGLINKACVTVPKALTEQMGAEWKRLYPNANVLVATANDFTKSNRKKFFARCATGDYDAIIMSHEQFGKISMSIDYQEHFIRSQLAALEESIVGAERYSRDSRASVKALERQKKNFEAKLKKLLDAPRDTTLSFEQLGFDYLVVDEAHNFKNCFVNTKMGNIAGVQTTSSMKATDMLMKCDYLNNRYDCHNILFATGTPISNSMTELYIMQRYLRPDLLRESNTINFDDWAATFGETVTKLEPRPDGNGFRSKKRFSKFVNLPELINFYKEFADIKTIDMLDLKVPEIAGGEPTVIITEPDEYQKAGVKELAARSEAIHNGNVEPNVDNMLKITGEARLLGLDARTKFPDAPDSENNKISAVVNNVVDYYNKTMEQKGVQAIFCDIAVNDNDGKFSAYKAIKNKLIEKGIPEEEICFAGDAANEKQRNEQHEKLRQGTLRVVLGSTGKMGTGVNIQDRLCAMHHLDIAWKPSDFEQRNGRGIRQGNSFSQVGVFHYVTQDTFDMYMMETVVRKSKFIGQVKKGNCPSRTCEDIDDMTLTYSRIQAATTSNPLILERFQLDEDLQELRLLRNQHTKNLFTLQKSVERDLPERIETKEILLEKVRADIRQHKAEETENFSIIVNGKVIEDRKEMCEEIDKAALLCAATHDSVLVGKIGSFTVSIEEKPKTDLFFMNSPYEIVLQGNLKYAADLGKDNGIGNSLRLENLFVDMENREKDFMKTLELLQKDYEESKAALNKPFDREEEYQQKERRFAELNELLADDEAANKFNAAGEEDDEQYAVDDEEERSSTDRDTSAANVSRLNNVIAEDETLDLVHARSGKGY